MAEYIKKDDVIEILRNLSHGTYNGIPVYSAEIDRATTDVYDLEPEDVAPVRHGYWSDYGCGVCCTNCGIYLFHQDENNNAGIEPSRFDFCPNCGAKMDGGDD